MSQHCYEATSQRSCHGLKFRSLVTESPSNLYLFLCISDDGHERNAEPGSVTFQNAKRDRKANFANSFDCPLNFADVVVENWGSQLKYSTRGFVGSSAPGLRHSKAGNLDGFDPCVVFDSRYGPASTNVPQVASAYVRHQILEFCILSKDRISLQHSD